MQVFKSTILFRVFNFLVVSLLLAGNIQSQDLTARLSEQTTYSPRAATTLDQLIEVAQHHRIPMGIEWIYKPRNEELPGSTPIKPTTVQGLISSILQRSPGYVAEQRNGVLHIAKAEISAAPENFLNLRISKFEVKNETLFGAEAFLKRSIRMTLHPERYAQGSAGGFGYGVPRNDEFDKPTITFGGRDLTVRQILNTIAATSDNVVWVVQLMTDQRMSSEPFFAQASWVDNRPTPDFYWKFIPFGFTKFQPQRSN